MNMKYLAIAIVTIFIISSVALVAPNAKADMNLNNSNSTSTMPVAAPNNTVPTSQVQTFNTTGSGRVAITPIVDHYSNGSAYVRTSPMTGQNHWYLTTDWSNAAGGLLPPFLNGTWKAVPNSINGLSSSENDCILYLPLNVAYGTSSNFVWYQFSIQYGNGSSNIGWYI